MHSAGRRRIRRPHGGCARPLCRGARSQAPGRLFRREPDPAHRRGAPADPGRSRASSSATIASTGAMERPICSSSSTCIDPGARSRSPTAAPQSTSPPACANSPTSTFPTPSGSVSCWTICRPTPPAHSTRPSPLRSATRAAPAGVPLCPQARQLAEHGRDRDRRAARPMSRPAHRHQGATRRRDRRLGTTAQCFRRPHQMDVHNRKSPRQNGPRLPSIRATPTKES